MIEQEEMEKEFKLYPFIAIGLVEKTLGIKIKLSFEEMIKLRKNANKFRKKLRGEK